MSTAGNVLSIFSEVQEFREDTVLATEAAKQMKKAFGDMGVDDAITAFRKLGVDGEDLVEILVKCGVKTDIIDVAVKKASKSGVGFIGKLKTGFDGLAATIGLTSAQLGTLLGVLAIPAAIVTAWKIYTATVQKSVEAAKEAASQFNSANASLEGQVSRLKELQATIDQGIVTEEEAYAVKSELYSIQRALCESYGEEAKSIDLVNGKLEDEIEKVKELNRVDAARLLNENRLGFKTAEKEMIKTRTIELGSIFNHGSATEVEAINQVLSKYSDYIHSQQDEYGVVQTVRFTGDATEASEVLNNLMTDLRKAAGEFEDGDIINSFADSVSAGLGKANEILEEHQATYEAWREAKLIDDDNTYSVGGTEDKHAIEWINEYTNAVDKYNEALKSGDPHQIANTSYEFNRLKVIMDALVAGPMAEYAPEVAEVETALNNAAIATHNFMQAANTEGSDIANAIEELKKFKLDDIDLMAGFESANTEEYEAAFGTLIQKAIDLKLILNDTPEEVQKLISLLVSMGVVGGQPVAAVTSSFSDFATYVDSATNSLSSLAKVQEAVANGFTVSVQKAMELAKVYPEILKSATVTADGQIKLNKDVVNAIISSKRDEVNAGIDAEIEKLEAKKVALTADMEAAQAELAIAKAVAEAEGDITKDLSEYKINANDALVAALIEMGIDETNANALAAEAMAGNQEEFARVAAECFGNIDKNAAQAAYDMASAFFINSKNSATSIAGIARQAHETAKAIAAMPAGVEAGTSEVIFTGADARYIARGTIEGYDATFKGSQFSYDKKNITLEDYISKIELDISSYQDSIAKIDGQIAVLQSLKKSSLSNFMDSGSSGSSGGGGMADATNAVEEYIATIEEYNAALQRLEDAQRERIALEKELEHATDLSDKIFISGNLIDAYEKEAQAESDLVDAKKRTINMNVSALRNLGFEVEYDSDKNRLFIKNLEHLNELTADSVGEYGSLQEATNALREETEELINATEQLNDENADSVENIEDLSYKILETKNNIVDYIEEIYKAQIDSYKKVIDERKKLIESAKEELDYEKQISEKVEEIADLQTEIDRLSLDDSRESQAQVAELRQQLKDKQEELNQLQSDHATDVQLETLDKMATDYEDQKNSEIELIRSTVQMSDEIWDAFYQTILGKTVDVGTSINTEITSAWISAAAAVKQYNDAVNGATGGDATVVSNLPVYHDGGVVSNSNIGDNEALAILEKGELVLDDAKKQTLYKILDSQDALYRALGLSLGNISMPDIRTDFGSLISRSFDHITSGMQSISFQPHIEVSINHNGTLTDSDAANFGNRIAETAIDTLYNAFESRGLISSRNARLRP